MTPTMQIFTVRLGTRQFETHWLVKAHDASVAMREAQHALTRLLAFSCGEGKTSSQVEEAQVTALDRETLSGTEAARVAAQLKPFETYLYDTIVRRTWSSTRMS